MTNRIERQSKAFDKALGYCRIFGLDFKENVITKINNKEIIGYYVLDETKSTTVATVML